jgi:hypothetical protein
MNNTIIIYILTEYKKTKQAMNYIKKTQNIHHKYKLTGEGTSDFFPASLHVGSIPFAKSIKFLYFSLILNNVFGRKVPRSSSLTVSNIVDILDGRMFTS